MDASLWRNLLCSTSSFLCLPSFDSFGLLSVSKNYQTIKEILEPMKSIAESIVRGNSATYDVDCSMAIKQIVQSIGVWANLFEDWHPLASRVHQAMKAELLMIKIRSSVLETVWLLKDSCQPLPAELSQPSFEHFIQKVKNNESESISTMIMEAKQKEFLGNPEKLGKLVHLLGLKSNLAILVEIMALKKLKNAGQTDYRGNLDDIDQLIDLLIHLHNHLFQLKRSQSSVFVPDDFRCRLSLDLMVHPVIVASGQTYERAYIRKWFNMGLTMCPATWNTLSHFNLIPNYTCKALITNWCELKNVKLPDLINSINEPFDLLCLADLQGEIKESVKNLFCHDGLLNLAGEVKKSTENLKSESLYTQKELNVPFDLLCLADLRGLESAVEESVKNLKSFSMNTQREATAQLLLSAKHNKEHRILIRDYGGIKSLVDLVHSIDPEIQQNVVTTLLYLAINDDNKTAITNSDAIGPLIYVLGTGTSEAQENSAATLFCLSMIHENKFKIGKSGAIGPLVQLLSKGTPQGRNNAIIALFNLSIVHENKIRIVQAGGAKFLVELSKDPVADLLDKAVATLESLCRICEGRAAVSEAGGIPALVEIVELGSARGKESAACALLQLCVNSNGYCNMVLLEGAVPPLVALMQSGTPRAKEKAKHLLGYFHSIVSKR